LTLVLFVVFVILMILDIPIAFSLFISSMAALLYSGAPLTAVIQRAITASDSFILLAIPFFMLAGNLMSGGGISQRIISFASSGVGFIRGGLAHVNILTSMIFAGITGAAVADTSAVGGIMIPSMIKEGYDKHFSAAITACSSVIGVIIPPSIPFVLYGVITGVSIGKLFLGGLIPGVLIGVIQMIICYFISKKNGYGMKRRFDIIDFGKSFGKGFFALFTPVIIVGGIITGIVTPTEAAILGAIYAFVVGVFVYKELAIAKIPKILWESAVTTAVVMFLVAGAFLYGWIITNDQIPQKVVALVTAITTNPTLVLLMFVGVYLIAGMFIDLGAAIILLVPVLYPATQSLGIDPLLFGIVTVVSLAIGLVTPPVGACLFISCEISKTAIMDTAKASIPFLVGIFLVLCIVIFFPQVVLYIPNTFM
jgi:C4-dicarboxylate transporter DctM subunit